MTAAPELTLRQVPLASIERADWDRLLSLTAAATPFARWTFHRAWWDAYGDTADERYLVATGADEDGDVPRAIVPLMRRNAADADPGVVFFGASYHADYATILGAATDMPLVADALPTPCATRPTRTWAMTRGTPSTCAGCARSIRHWPRSSTPCAPTTPAGALSREDEDVCPVVTVPSADWDEYLATLDKKHRHEIRRKIRRAAAIGDLIDRDLSADRGGDRGLHRPARRCASARTVSSRTTPVASAAADSSIAWPSSSARSRMAGSCTLRCVTAASGWFSRCWLSMTA